MLESTIRAATDFVEWDELLLDGPRRGESMNPLCELLEWDTEFFGHRIARVNGNRLDERLASEVVQWCRRERIDCLYLLTDAADVQSITTAEHHSFGMKDVRLTYKKRLSPPLKEPSLESPSGVRMRDSRPEDLSVLESLSEGNYTESRFYFDRRFNRQAVSLMYKIWIRKSVEGEAERVWVLEWNGRPAGFITCHLLGGRTGQCRLGGLHPALRGKGLGRHLYDTALHWFAQQGVETVIYVTQARNVQAQRLFQRLGFLSDSTQIWYHKWFDHGPVPDAA
jgi:dTDP-4-amino-4,6-dideoxy-D-galactose acyltransferase